jgi:hypothetical protein
MSYHVKVSDSFVNIIRTEDGRIMWNMRVPNIADTIEDNISEWVSHLDEKSWVDSSLLYELAVIIQQLHPDNLINWYDTFSRIERGEYLDRAFELKQSTENKSGSTSTTFMDRVRFGRESFNDDEERQVEQILLSRLADYKLPFRK